MTGRSKEISSWREGQEGEGMLETRE